MSSKEQINNMVPTLGSIKSMHIAVFDDEQGGRNIRTLK